MSEHRERVMPPVPPIVREPLRLGQVSIPSRFCLAPLAGYTSLAFRLAVRDCGGLGLATTDLVNARSLIEKRRRAFELAETCEQDRPLAIQIYGSVIAEMEQAARWVEQQGASAVDINMGCPVRKVVKTGGGSALMCQIDRAVELVAAIVEAVNIPVTVKMRLGWDDESLTAPALARAFEQVGVAAVIVHGRTRQQGFTGKRQSRRASARWWKPSTRFRSSPTATSARSPTPPRPLKKPAARPSRSAVAHWPIRLSFVSSTAGARTGAAGSRAELRRTAGTDAAALPRARRAARRALRLPAVPQDAQVVLPFHADGEIVLSPAHQPLEPGRL